MRTPEGAVKSMILPHGEAYIHRLEGEEQAATYTYAPKPIQQPRINVAAVLARWLPAVGVAGDLGVSDGSLARLGAMDAKEYGAVAFPMFDAKRQPVGIRLRKSDGRKWAVTGSRSGVFIPSGLTSRKTLMICEGPTDTAAALTLGFDAIGRPSCSGAVNIIADMLRVGRRRDIVIMADYDGPGRTGSEMLAGRISHLARTIKIITAAPHKDIRQWLCNGATSSAVEVRINNARYYSREAQ